MNLQDVNIGYRKIEIPDYKMIDEIPEIPPCVYAERLQRLQERLREEELDEVIIYADREHMQNLDYIFGIDIWFEEALGIVFADRDCCLILGNECLPLAIYSKVPARSFHCSILSLPGQPQEGMRIKECLEKAGIGEKHRVGCIGWKQFEDDRELDFPTFIIDALTEITGDRKYLKNATGVMTSPGNGLRNFVEPEQAAVYEFSATNVSAGMLKALDALDENVRELDIAKYMNPRGLPLSCHTNVSSGIRTRTGLVSPSGKRIEKGDPVTLCWAMRGALSCRSGYAVHNAKELPNHIQDYMDKIVKPYFRAAVAWYQHIGIGVCGGEMYELVQSVFPKEQYGWYLNPGHNLGTEEWLNSSIYKNSNIKFRSGQMVQLDIIPAAQNGYASSNIEDGILIADYKLQEQLSRKYPKMWERILRRKNFMKEVLGICLKGEILPLYDTQGILNPYMLNRGYALTIER